MILTNYYIKKKINSLAKQAPFREHSYCALQQAQDVLLVYSAEDREQIRECIKKLRDQGKNVYGCMYLPTGKPYETDTTHLQVKEETDTDLFLLPKGEVMAKFKELPADILIDLSRSSEYAMHYLVLSHSALLKVGKKHGEQAMHDISLLVGPEDNVGELFDHIVFYLQTIRGK